MQSHSKLRRSVLSSIVAVAMVGTLSFAPALASAQQESQDLTIGTMSAGVPEWAVDDGGDAQEGALTAQAAIPETYDLRAEGLVTPVKQQGPWGSCWAFGGTAAAETSMLSAYGSTYEKSKLDLSEKHLTYFALQPVSESDNPAQAGEGLHTLDTSANAAFDAGGLPIYITTLYSQGVGPVLESLFPYRGKEGVTALGYTKAHPREAAKQQLETELASYGRSYDQYIASRIQMEGTTEDEILDGVAAQLIAIYETKNTYAKQDDWSIPERNDDGESNRLMSGGMVLKNGNVLPGYWAKATDENPVEESTNAIKQELLNGRGVTIMYFADKNGQYSAAPGQSTNANTNHNQYVYEAGTGINHGVEIVGWDDTYAKENFAHGDSAEAQAATTPKGDGAWIVKNSWGSETDATEENADDLGNVMAKGTFGNLDGNGKATGFFYLSYYDRSILQPETMEFSANLGAEGSFAALQYDFMPADSGFYTTPVSSKVTSSANVFAADGADITVKSVSTRTSEINTRVTFAVYKLNDGATDPTDGEMLYRTSQNFAYGGFHRLDLDKPITFTAGTKFSVVSTASTVDNTGKRSYSVSANRGYSKAAIEEYKANHPGAEVKTYSTAVVNKGESYLYDGKEWKDWSEYLAALPANAETQRFMQSDTYTEVCPVDNFSIKVYAEPVDNSQEIALEEAQKAQKDAEDKAASAEKEMDELKASIKTDISSAKVTVAKATYTGKALEPNVKVSLDGKTLKAGSDYEVSYANNKNAGEAVAVVKGTGSYTGAVAKTFTIQKAKNTLTAKAKAKQNTVKWSKLKNSDQVIKMSKAFNVSGAKGDVTFAKQSGNKKITVSKAGKVTVKKGLKKNTYAVKVKVKAAGNANYKPITKNVTLKIKVA